MLHYAANADLSQNNTLNLPCIARHFISLDSPQDLLQAFQQYPELAQNFLVLGEGSNLILPPFLDCYVVHFNYHAASAVRVVTRADGGETLPTAVAHQEHEQIWVDVDAGVNWDEFVAYTVAQGWYGLENLSLIPGTVGAAPIQNIGAYGVEVADTLSEVEVFDVEQQQQVILSTAQCRFAYRDSLFKQTPGRYIILRVRFCLSLLPFFKLTYGELAALSQRDALTAADVRQAVINARQAKLPDPKLLPNAGSFFKNPIVSARQGQALQAQFPDLVSYPLANGDYKLAAGWLIEKAGWKGFRNEHVGVHDRQALVLINHQQGTQDALLSLAEEIQRSVTKLFSVQLEIEPLVLKN